MLCFLIPISMFHAVQCPIGNQSILLKPHSLAFFSPDETFIIAAVVRVHDSILLIWIFLNIHFDSIRYTKGKYAKHVQWQSFNNAETGTAQRCSVAHHSPNRVFCDAKHKKISPFVYRHRRYLLAFPLSSSLSKTNIAKFTTIRNEVRKRKRIAADDDNISANEKMRKVYRKYETFYIRHAVQNWHLMPNCQPFRKKLSLHSNCRHHSFSGERKNAAKHGTMNAISVNTQNLFDLSFAIQNSVLFVCIS